MAGSIILLTFNTFQNFNSSDFLIIIFLGNVYVYILNWAWRFPALNTNGLKNEIDSFDFQKEELKIDSFDLVRLHNDPISNSLPQNNSSPLKYKPKSFENFENNNRLRMDYEDPNGLWIEDRETPEINMDKSNGYQTFEDSPRKEIRSYGELELEKLGHVQLSEGDETKEQI